MQENGREQKRYRTGSDTRLGVIRRNAGLLLAVFPLAAMLMGALPSQAQQPVTGSAVAIATLNVGAGPWAMAINPATGNVYVANQYDDTMSIIDGTTNVVTTFAAGNTPGAVAVNPVTNTIYLANSGEATVWAIDASTLSVTAQMSVGLDPAAIAVNTVTNTVYVANFGSSGSGTPCTVSVINGSTNTVTATVTVGANPVAIAVSESLNQVYVANRFSNTLTAINGATNLTTTVPVGAEPVAVAVNTTTEDVYVVSGSGGTVSTISGMSLQTTNTLSSGTTYGAAAAADPVANRVYVANGNATTTVTAIDGATYGTLAIPVHAGPSAAVTNLKSNYLYIANNTANSVSVIDGSNNNLPTVATLSTAPGPVAVVANPLTGKIYVASTDYVLGSPAPSHGTVSIFSEAQYSQTKILTAGKTVSTALPFLVSSDIDLATQQVYVTNSLDNTVSVIDEASSQTSTVNVGNTPVAVAANSASNQIYVANFGSNSITVIDGNTKATQTFGVATGPFALSINAQTNKTYVASHGYATAVGTIAVIDGATNALTTIGTGGAYSFWPVALAVNGQTNKIYVACSNYVSGNFVGALTVIDGATNATTTVSLGAITPVAIAVDSTANKIYVAGYGAVNVIDGNTNTMQATIPLAYTPAQVAVNPLTHLVYVTSAPSNNYVYDDSGIIVLDGDRNVVANTFIFQGAASLAVDTARNRVYISGVVGNSSYASLGIMDGGKNITGMVGVSGSFSGETYLDYASGGLLVDPLTGTVFVVEPSTGEGATKVKMFQQPTQLAAADTLQFAPAVAAATGVPISPALASQTKWPSNPSVAQISIHTVLLIHGRFLDTKTMAACQAAGKPLNCNVQYGAQTSDQSGAWAAGAPATGPRVHFYDSLGAFPTGFYKSQVRFVQWDAWNNHYDYGTWPGGYAVINQAMNEYCTLGQIPPGATLPSSGCSVICHSAGCAAFEFWLAWTNGVYPNNGIYIQLVMAAGSAAGGSEWADDFGWLPNGTAGQYKGTIDQSLTTSYAREVPYYHNFMEQTIYDIGGTQFTLGALTAVGCGIFPGVTLGTKNPDCYQCLGFVSTCADSTVSLHSSCAHNRVGAFQDCNSSEAPYNDTAGTYDWHTWWGRYPNDVSLTYNFLGLAPYSYVGQYYYNPTFHTYRVNHGGTKNVAVQEYSYCNLRPDPSCP